MQKNHSSFDDYYNLLKPVHAKPAGPENGDILRALLSKYQQ